MNNIEKIEYSRNLNDEKSKLQKELIEINKSIEELQDSCSHIGIIGKDHSNCLLCGKTLILSELEDKLVVDANNFLDRKYNVDYEPDYIEEKFDVIRTLAIGIMKANPKISNLEFVNELNSLIGATKESKENIVAGPKLVKKMNK